MKKPSPKPVDEATLQTLLSQAGSSRNIRRLVQKQLKAKMKHPRYFRLLPDIVLTNLDGQPARDPGTEKPLVHSHKEFIRNRLVDPAFVSDTPKDPMTVHWNMPAIMSAQVILSIVMAVEVGDVIAIEDDDWQRLKRSVEKATTYNVVGAMSCIPFMREITGASVDKPKELVTTEPKIEPSAGPSEPSEPPTT